MSETSCACQFEDSRIPVRIQGGATDSSAPRASVFMAIRLIIKIGYSEGYHGSYKGFNDFGFESPERQGLLGCLSDAQDIPCSTRLRLLSAISPKPYSNH